MKPARPLPLLLGLALTGLALAAGAPTAQVGLQPTFGGALLVGRVNATDTLTGVWSPQGRARLLRCQPRCTTVQTVPVSGVLLLGQETPFRVVVSGDFRPGQRLKLALRFTDMRVLNVSASVHAP